MQTSIEAIGGRSLQILWKTLRSLLLGLVCIVGLLFLISLAGIALPINFLKETVEDAARDAIGRELDIDGDIRVIPGLTLMVSIEDARLGNPTDWSKSEFITVSEISAELHLIPLVSRQLHIGDVSIKDVAIDLVQSTEAKSNWKFDIAESDPKGSIGNPDNSPAMEILALDSLYLSNIDLKYHNQQSGQQFSVNFDNALVSALQNQPVKVDIHGVLNQQPLSLNFKTTSLRQLVKGKLPLDFNLQSRLGPIELQIDGRIKQGGIELQAELLGTDSKKLASEFDLNLPAINHFQVSTSLDYAGTQLTISSLKILFDDSEIGANLQIDHAQKPLTIVGIIDVDHLNLDPFLSTVDDNDAGEVSTSAENPAEKFNGEQADISKLVTQISNFAVDIALNIGTLRAGSVNISDSAIQLLLEDGKLETPLAINLNSIPMEGSLSLLESEGRVVATADLNVENKDIGELEQLFKLEGVDGSLGKLSFHAQTSGTTAKELVSGLHTNLLLQNANLSYGNEENGQVVSFSINQLTADVAEKDPLTLKVNGLILGQDFALGLKGGKLRQLIKGREWPLQLNASGAGANLNVSGHVRAKGEDMGTQLKISLSGESFGDLDPWLGTGSESAVPYSLSSKVSTSRTGWSVENLDISLGDTTLQGSASNTVSDGGSLLTLFINSDRVNLPELTGVFSTPEDSVSDNTKGEKLDQIGREDLILEMPILPQGIALPDTNIEVEIGEFRLEAYSIDSVKFKGHVREGKLKPSPFSMSIGEAQFDGEISLNLVTQQPEANLQIGTSDVNIGGLLELMQFTEDLEVSAGQLELDLNLRGASLGNILANSEITGEIKEGEWNLKDGGSGLRLPVIIKTANLKILPGEPTQFNSKASIRGEALEIDIVMDHPITIKNTRELNLDLTARYGASVLKLRDHAKLPFNFREMDLVLDFAGDQLNDLSALVGLRMPALGPFQVKGGLRVRDHGYFLDQFDVVVGSSVLQGRAQLLTNTPVPEFDVSLISENIQLSDFGIKNKDQIGSRLKTGITSDELDAAPEALGDEKPPLFTAETLAIANGSFELNAKQVRSGEDWLGEGKITVELKDSHLNFNRVLINVEGGAINAKLSLVPQGDGIQAALTAKVDTFDYGILARRIDPDSSMSGLVYFDVDLNSETRYLNKLLENANGHLDFVVIPEGYESDAIDLWAVSLVNAILPKFGSDVSVVNCLVARFDMEDGIMTADTLVLDTSKIRVDGKGTINLRDETIDVLLVPKAKKPQFFRVEAPLKVKGSYSDLSVNMSGGLIGTAIRMTATTYTTAVSRIFGKKIPEDGSDLCTKLNKREE